jgi:hypothetical protein
MKIMRKLITWFKSHLTVPIGYEDVTGFHYGSVLGARKK